MADSQHKPRGKSRATSNPTTCDRIVMVDCLAGISTIIDVVDSLLETVTDSLCAANPDAVKEGTYGPVDGLHWAMGKLSIAVRDAEKLCREGETRS